MQTEYKTALWTLRVFSFFAMWLGLFLIVSSPLDFLGASFLSGIVSLGSLLEGVGKFGVGILTFAITTPVWVAVFMVANIAHNLALMIATGLLVMGFAVYTVNRRTGKRGRWVRNDGGLTTA